jgi:hypothetical protein
VFLHREAIIVLVTAEKLYQHDGHLIEVGQSTARR